MNYLGSELVGSSCGCRYFAFGVEEGSGKVCCDWKACPEIGRGMSSESLGSLVGEMKGDKQMLTVSLKMLEMRGVLHAESSAEEKVEEVEKAQRSLENPEGNFLCCLLVIQY